MVKGIIAVQRGLRAMDAAFKVIGASNRLCLQLPEPQQLLLQLKTVGMDG
ncbi:hypothetical protein [Treponema phagedenis]|nr:hypothetical protein [Treponema phagedenis]